MGSQLDDVSIVVAPRERFSSITSSLKSLFSTIPDSVPVIVVEGGTPDSIRNDMTALNGIRAFEHVHYDSMIIPNVARNIGAMRTTTKYVVFTDNDMQYEKGWLEALVGNAKRENADAVAPMICIGPPAASIIHHAGGMLAIENKNGVATLVEHHRLMNKPISSFSDEAAPIKNEVCEFHCCLIRRELFDKIGGLNEYLITREQMDFALCCKALNAKVTFERASVVTYMARTEFDPIDLPYHLFRWADALAVRSIDVFEDRWHIPLNRKGIRYSWIAQHRTRAAASIYKNLRLLLGNRLFAKIVTRWHERKVAADVLNALSRRPDLQPHSFDISATDLLGARS